MHLSNRDFRAMIYKAFFGGKSHHECFPSLNTCFGEKSSAKSTVTKWYRLQITVGRQALEDEKSTVAR